LHNEELHYVYASLNTIREMNSRRMRWAGRVAHMGEIKKAYKTLAGHLKGGDHPEDIHEDGNIILEWISGN
jgi:hypothetical protein